MKRSTLLLPVRLVVVSPVRMIREGLANSVRDCIDVRVVAKLEPARLSSLRMNELHPNVVLIDVATRPGLRLGYRLKVLHPTVKLLAFAISETVEDVFACAASGFSGYLPADCHGEQVVEAVLDVVDGRLQCSPHIASAIFERLASFLQGMPVDRELSQLTGREQEILSLAAVGLSNKEIAGRLDISRGTVKNHMHNVLHKLGVGRRGKAVALLHSYRGNTGGVANSNETLQPGPAVRTLFTG